jgi:hypothetical protein
MESGEKMRIIMEGRIIERRLKPDKIDNMKPPEELYRKIIEELKQKGIYHEENFKKEL